MINWIIILIVLAFNLIYWWKALNRIEFSENDSKITKLIPTNWHFFIFIISIGIIGFFLNKVFQVFCQPVMWSLIVLILVNFSIGLHPLINSKNIYLKILIGIFQGVGIIVISYIFVFGWGIFIIGLFVGFPFLLIGLALIPFNKKNSTDKKVNPFAIIMYEIFFSIFSPFLFGFLIIRNFIKHGLLVKTSMIIGIILILSIGFFHSNKYRLISKQIQEKSVNEILRNKEISSQITDNYIGERIIGMHFKYHTKICLYDGWRPPLHDPLLVFALWINKNHDPLPKYPLNDRLELYKVLFPENNIRASCSCANKYSENYWQDELLDEYENK